jgi:hypothetical protein
MIRVAPGGRSWPVFPEAFSRAVAVSVADAAEEDENRDVRPSRPTFT